MAPCSRRTQLRAAQTRNCLLMLSRVMPTISLISCCVMAIVRPPGASLSFSVRRIKRAGEPARQILQDHLFDLVAGPAQPRAQQLDELHRELGLASHKGKKFAAIDRENFAIGIRRGVGRPRLPIEHRHLSEDLAGADQIQDRVAAIGRGNADLDRAADHRKQAVAGIALGKDRGSPLQRGVLGVAAELVERLGFKIAKNRMIAQDRQRAARDRPRRNLLVLGHAGHDHLMICVVRHPRDHAE